jgi:hypothetical protein
VLKGDIPLPLPRPTEQQISDFKADQAKTADVKDSKPVKGVAAAAKNKGVKTEAASEADDDKAAKKRKPKHKG